MSGMIKHILLLVDRSEGAVSAARFAIQLAKNQGAGLTAAVVVDTETLRNLLRAHIFVDEEMEEYEREMEGSCRKQLNYVTGLAEKASVKLDTIMLKGSIHATILEKQKAMGCDLLVMAGFVSSLARRDVIAREKQLVVDESMCPVLLVR